MALSGARALLCAGALALLGCGAPPPPATHVLTVAGTAVGAEGAVLARQLARFAAQHPGVRVELRETPDQADQRHQLYVQWLNAHASEPDLLQIDVVWTAELAQAGWLMPLAVDDDLFPAARAAARVGDTTWAAPLFVDVGMLYYRKDLVAPPRSLDELARQAQRAPQLGVRDGLALQAARYEGLVTVFVELLGGFGGRLVDERGRPAFADAHGEAALTYLRALINEGAVPREALTWQEEQARWAFQNGDALFMRNWPYAAPLLADARTSRVAGRFDVTAMPAAEGGAPTAALGGALLAVNARTREPELARELSTWLTAPEQLRERALTAGQWPPRPSLYDDPALARLPIAPARVRAILEHAVARPATPRWAQESAVLAARLHAALTGQVSPSLALQQAATTVRAVEESARPATRAHDRAGALLTIALVAGALLLVALRLRGAAPGEPGHARLFLLTAGPALALLGTLALAPLAWTVWDSLHRHDLALPHAGRPFVGLGNYAAALASPRVQAALLHTAIFVVLSVGLELLLGLGLALALGRAFRGRGLLRAAVLVPWALPTVVTALLFRFFFEGRTGLANLALAKLHLVDAAHPVVWLASATWAWTPLILADAWKTTPFVALLLLAGLSSIDPTLYEAARVDGAGRLRQLFEITLPLLRPAIVVALLFRTLDALRVFDLVYVLTGGGPGTATEPLALAAYDALFTELAFGRGAAIAVILFALALGFAIVQLGLMRRSTGGAP